MHDSIADVGIEAHSGADCKTAGPSFSADFSDIDFLIFLRMKNNSDHIIRGGRKTHATDKIIAGTGGDTAKSHFGKITDSVDYLIDRAVAADDNDRAGLLSAGKLSGKNGSFSIPGQHKCFVRDIFCLQDFFCMVPDLLPAPGTGGGVYNKIVHEDITCLSFVLYSEDDCSSFFAVVQPLCGKECGQSCIGS